MVGGTRALVMTEVEGGSRAAAPKEKEEEKIPLMCESIGHRPFRGRCPKGAMTEPQERNDKLRLRKTSTTCAAF